jgi:acid phosphatase family membrane protein YuiD
MLTPQFLEYFFTDADAAFFASLGLNCIRLPVNYRHLEDDMAPAQSTCVLSTGSTPSSTCMLRPALRTATGIRTGATTKRCVSRCVSETERA